MAKLSLLGSTLAFMTGTNAQAQAGAASTLPVEKMEKFVVTGSNIPTATDEPSLPISIVNRERIETLGIQTTSDLLQMLPQVVGSGNYRGEQVSNPGGGEATVALRGLPASATLVLVNGRRVALTSGPSLSNNAVNINTIPLAAVERVEVLREGAGPVYGSDAIAGVVNIILRRNYRGSEMTLEYGNTTQKDNSTVIGSFIAGAGTDKTDVVVTGSFYENKGVYSRDRDLMKTADYRSLAAVGGRDTRSSGAPRGRIFVNEVIDPVGAGIAFNGAVGGTGTVRANYSNWNSNTNPYNFREITAEILPQKRYGISLNATHKISSDISLFAEANYTRVRSLTDAAPTPFFSDSEPFEDLSGQIIQMTIPIGNIHNPFGAGSSDGRYAVDAVYKRFLELGPRRSVTTVNNSRLLGGFRGTIQGWNWEVAALYSKDATNDINSGLVNKRELYSQLQNTNRAVASVNVFGDPDFNTKDAAQKAALERLRLTAVNDSSYTTQQIDAKINGKVFDLPAGPVGIAAGAENRKEQFTFNPDSAITSFNTIGSTNQVATRGSRDVVSLYTEIGVPIANRLPGIHSLDLTLAGRYEDYNDFGTTFKPGASLRWKPIDESFAVRGSYSEGFRAASLQELYLGGQESFEDLENPNAPNQIQARSLYSGNPRLEPEESKSWNVGLVYTPKFVRNLTLRLDYYTVLKKNNIGVLESQFVFDRFLAGDPTFQRQVDINPVSKFATLIRVPYANLGKEVSRGYDYGFSYVIPSTNLGRFTVSLDGAYLATYLYTPDKTAAYLEGAGDYSNAIGNALPRHRGSLSTQWHHKNFDAGLSWNYIYGLREPLSGGRTHKIDNWNTFDVQLGYGLPNDMKVAIGVLNAADEKVPFIAGAGSNAYSNETHDMMGRNYYVRVTKKF